MTKVVNKKNHRKTENDVYIGRPSKWGNPYTHISNKKTKAEFVVSTREEAIQKFREYILTRKDLIECVEELRGKNLVCWCSPLSCHGDVYLEILNSK